MYDPEKEKRRPSPFDDLRHYEECHHWIHKDEFDNHEPCKATHKGGRNNTS
jgi:hypothetical protein